MRKIALEKTEGRLGAEIAALIIRGLYGFYLWEVVDAVGIEPTASRLRVECSQYTNCLYFH